MTAPDIKALIGEVARRHGVTLKPDDPAFALVTLNQLVLEQAVDGLNEQTRNATREFQESLSRLQTQTGSILGAEVRNATSQIRKAFVPNGSTVADDTQRAATRTREGRSLSVPMRWLASGVIAGLALFLLGVLVGHLWK